MAANLKDRKMPIKNSELIKPVLIHLVSKCYN